MDIKNKKIGEEMEMACMREYLMGFALVIEENLFLQKEKDWVELIS